MLKKLFEADEQASYKFDGPFRGSQTGISASTPMKSGIKTCNPATKLSPFRSFKALGQPGLLPTINEAYSSSFPPYGAEKDDTMLPHHPEPDPRYHSAVVKTKEVIESVKIKKKPPSLSTPPSTNAKPLSSPPSSKSLVKDNPNSLPLIDEYGFHCAQYENNMEDEADDELTMESDRGTHADDFGEEEYSWNPEVDEEIQNDLQSRLKTISFRKRTRAKIEDRSSEDASDERRCPHSGDDDMGGDDGVGNARVVALGKRVRTQAHGHDNRASFSWTRRRSGIWKAWY